MLLAALLAPAATCHAAATEAIEQAAQQASAKGTVVDAHGEPVIGATVRVKGKSEATVTDLDGNFSISAERGQTLVISYIGFDSQEVAYKGAPLHITLKEDATSLEELVVVGYGSMRKKDLTGSVVQIRPDRLANEAPKTVQDVLRGTPGLNVGYDASAKGGGSMQVRGQRSVYTGGGHNDPLIILDGMQFYGELSEINPADIGQIDVLKDASACAVYGAKGANGVIVITTKKGKTGKPTINVGVTVTANTKSDFRDVFGADEYVGYLADWYRTQTYGVNPDTGAYEVYQARDKNGNLVAQPGYYDNPEQLAAYGITQDQWAAYSNNPAGASMRYIWGQRLKMEDAVLDNFEAAKTYDWYKRTFRTGFNQDYHASVSGASDRVNYYLSFSYLKNQGAVRGNDYNAYRANMKINGKITDWFEVGANVNFQDRSDGDIQVGIGSDYWDNNMLRNSPYSNYTEEDGSFSQYPMGNVVKRGYNYDFERQYMELERGYTTLNTVFNAKISLPYGIKYEFNIAPRYQFYYNREFASAQRPNTNPDSRGVNRNWAKRYDYSLNNTITWDYTFAKKHHVVLTAVQEAEERRYWSDNIKSLGIYPSDALGFHNTQNGTKTLSSFSTSDTHETAAAYMGRLFYSYDDRYMLTATVRRDGYCAFGTNNPWATFFSISGAWTFTNEKFFKWKPMTTGKLRLSWGENGNRSLSDPYVALSNLGSGTGQTMGYLTQTGDVYDMKYLAADRLANPNLQWEKTQSTNIGLDFGFFDDRLTGSLDVYLMKTHDMIMGKRLPGFSGFGSITTNLGEVQNNGFELSLSSVNIKNKNFEWRTTLGTSFNKNTIKHLYYEMEDVKDAEGNVIGQKEMDDTSNGWFIGRPISQIWNYRVTGIWQKDQVEEAAKYGQKPGDPIVENYYTADDKVNKDGTVTPVYNDKDKQYLGQTAPKVRLSMRNEFTLWKDFEISFSLYSNLGHKCLAGYYLNNDNGGNMVTYCNNTYKKEYWTVDNPTNEYGRLNASGPNGAQGAQRLYNRSFVRIDNLSLSYTLPRQMTGKWGLSRVKVFGTVRNLACFGAWEYGDPETGGLATRQFTFGLDVTL